MRVSTLCLFVAVALLQAPEIVADPGQPTDADSGRTVLVQAETVPHGNGGDKLGRLRHRAILHLTSNDQDFGGFSGLSIGGRRLTAVSDQGHWLTAELELDPRGTVTGLRAARMGSLCDDDAVPVAGERRDAEEVQYLPGHGYVVSFERHHRLVLYPASGNGAHALAGVPRPFPFPPAIVPTRRNKGMEAVVLLADGRLLTFAEDLRTIDDDIIGWIGHPQTRDWRHLILPAFEDYLPTGATLLPGGDLLLLVRSYREETGNRIRILLLESSSLVPDARLQPIELARIEPPATVDNMEAVATGTGPGGETFIYLLSDNNYNDGQRTLLMQLELLASLPDSQ